MANRLLTLLLLSLTVFGGESRCGDRLERALDMMQQRGNSARRRFDTDDTDVVYHQRLRSAPIEVSVTKLVVEVCRFAFVFSLLIFSFCVVVRLYGCNV